MIKLSHVTYRYRDDARAALRDFSTEITSGEAVCVMGRNGSGKSTLVRLIAGLIKPERGDITVRGEVPDDDDVCQNVGILFQNTDNQMVATLVEKEIAFALENRAVPQESMEQEIDRVAERFGISHLRRRLTSELSGGEKQRVALASVMVQRPPVLLLDEPDTFLDEDGRRLLQKELERIHRDDPELVEIRITQSPAVARHYARLMILSDGEIAADGAPDDVFSNTALMREAGLTSRLNEDRRLIVPGSLLSTSAKSTNRLRSVKLDSVDFAYLPDHLIAENVSMSVSNGEIVGLVGPTGIGKSSLGLLACGLLEPNEGSVALLNGSGGAMPPEDFRGQIVAILQQPERQFFLESCAAEIKFGPANLGRELSDDEVTCFFEMVGLDPREFSGRDPFSLSGGEKRRLAFAAVLAMAPSLAVFDEPTAGLDPQGVGRFIVIARALKEQGIGQLIISHEGEIIRHLADRILYLKSSNELLELTPDEFFGDDRYADVVSKPGSLLSPS